MGEDEGSGEVYWREMAKGEGSIWGLGEVGEMKRRKIVGCLGKNECVEGCFKPFFLMK